MYSSIAGVDEAGRGPLAGPVITAAVILDPNKPIEGLADSKTLTAKRRLELYQVITQNALAWSIGRAEVQEIDQLNIAQATLLAMKRAVTSLTLPPYLVMIDGLYCPQLPMKTQAVVHGDQKIAQISAASILAKVYRDNEMIALSHHFPQYGFAHHKGYPTREHIYNLGKWGVTKHHRQSFAPVKSILMSKGLIIC